MTDEFAPPPEGARASVGAVVSYAPTGAAEVLSVSWPYPPCRTWRVTRSREVKPLGTAGRGTLVRRWQVWLEGTAAPRVLFGDGTSFFVRQR